MATSSNLSLLTASESLCATSDDVTNITCSTASLMVRTVTVMSSSNHVGDGSQTDDDSPSYSYVDEDTFKRIRFAIACLFHPSFAIIGIVCNFFSIVTLSLQGFANASTISLFFMAINDMIVCLLNLATYTDCFIGSFDSAEVQNLFKVLIDVIKNVRIPFRFTSIDIIAFIAIERFVAINFPLKIGNLFPKSRVIKIIIGFCVLNTFIAVIHYLPVKVPYVTLIPIDDRFDNLTQMTMINTDNMSTYCGSPIPSENQGHDPAMTGGNHTDFSFVANERDCNSKYEKIVEYVQSPDFVKVTFVIGAILLQSPSLITAVCCVGIISGLRSQSKWRKTMASSDNPNQERINIRITRQVLAVMITYLMSSLPYLTFTIYCVSFPLECGLNKNYTILSIRYIASFIGSLTYTFTFFLYVAFNQRFLNTFLGFFCSCCVKKQK